jgi:predicted metalloprotease with PDZ domain
MDAGLVRDLQLRPLRNDFAFFTGTNVFFYPEGRSFDFPATVNVRTESNWLIATGMPSAAAPRTYTSQNFHDLVDFPFFVGRFDFDSTQVSGKWIRLATYPSGFLAGQARADIWDALKKMIPPMVAVFGETPFSNYTVLQIADSSYGGASGLEHQNSHVNVISPFALGNPILHSLNAHEVFHAWNVKRLRPAHLWPYRYDVPQPTEWLWVSEGITDYYADISTLRGGVIDSIGFFSLTAGKIDHVNQTPVIALEDASLATWIGTIEDPDRIYYDKGSLAGFMLDIMIRDASDNARSLDDVLRELYRTSFKAGKGFTGEQFWGAVSTAAGGKSFTDFNSRYIDGREPYPWNTMLPLAGLRLMIDTLRFPVLGIVTLVDSGGVRISSVDPGSPAFEAGVRAGDVLLGVGDIAVEDQEFGVKFRARYTTEGAALPLRVRRDGRPLTLTGKVRHRMQFNARIVPDRTASAKAARIRAGILHGTTGPR